MYSVKDFQSLYFPFLFFPLLLSSLFPDKKDEAVRDYSVLILKKSGECISKAKQKCTKSAPWPVIIFCFIKQLLLETKARTQVRDHMIRDVNLKKKEIWEKPIKMHQNFQKCSPKKGHKSAKIGIILYIKEIWRPIQETRRYDSICIQETPR